MQLQSRASGLVTLVTEAIIGSTRIGSTVALSRIFFSEPPVPLTEKTSFLCIPQGPVVRKPVSANLGLNFNLGFFFLLSKAVSRIIFSILFRVSNHQIVGKEN